MADIFDEVAKPQTQTKQAAPPAPSSSAGDVFDQAAKQVYSPANQDEALRNLESNPGDKWYQQRVDVSPEAGPISRFTGNIIGNPSLEDLGTGLSYELRHPLNSARMLLESSGEQQRDLFNRAKREWNTPGVVPKGLAALHAAESVIPFVGPGLARASEQFATGDIAGGGGTVTGLSAPALLGPGATEAATEPIRATGRAIASPTGSRLIGGGAGAVIGKEVGHPWIGFFAGERVLRPAAEGLGERMSRIGLPEGPRPLFDLSTKQPPRMVMDALRRSNPASPSPISVEIPGPAPYRMRMGEVLRDVIRPRGLLTSGEAQRVQIAAPQEPIRFSLGIPDTPAPIRIGPGGIAPEDVGVPNPRVLAGNKGVIRTRLGLLPEYHPVSDAAFMNPEIGLPSPRAELKIGMPERLEDAAIQDAMNADLEQHGAAARLEQGRELAERNSVGIPKWQRTAEAKARAIMDEARQKAEESALTRELGRGMAKPVKAKPTIATPEAKPSGPPGISARPQGKLPGVRVPSPEESQDLTQVLEESLRRARLKKGR